MTLILQLTDGTTTLSLNDGSNYGIPHLAWTPAVTPRRRSGVGGWVYAPVVERIPVHVRGTTGANAMAALEALVHMLDRAERWAHEESGACVRLKFLPHNTALGGNHLEAEVIGASGAFEAMLSLTPYLNDAGNYELPEVTIEVRRREWLGVEVSATAAEPVEVAELATCTFGGAIPLPSPLSLKLAGLEFGTEKFAAGVAVAGGVLFVAATENDIGIIDAEGYNAPSPSGPTVVADGTARGGEYVRLATGEYIEFDWLNPLTMLNISGDLLSVWGMCHLTQATDAWEIKAEIYRRDSPLSGRSQAITIVDGLTGYQVVRLGLLARATDLFNLRITANRLSGSGSFEIDTVVLLNVTQPTQRAIVINPLNFYDETTAADVLDMHINHERMGRVRPRGYVQFATQPDVATLLDVRGDIALASAGNTVCVAWLAGGSTWLFNDDNAPAAVTVTARRRPVYLSPR